MGDITLSEEQFQELLRQAASEAVQQVQNSSHLEAQIGGLARPFTGWNWQKDREAWNRLPQAEKERCLINQNRANEAADDREPILIAKDIVARARKSGETVDKAILDLSRQDVTQFDTARVEILAADVHIGDGRRAGTGAQLMCHPKFAEILIDLGHAKLIEYEEAEIDAENATDAGVVPLKRVSGS